MKIIHIADLHWDADKLAKCQTSARFIEEQVQIEKPELIVIAGDLQDRRQYLDGSSAVNPMIEHIERLANIAPLAIVMGNEDHDHAGSLDVLRKLETKHPIHLSDTAETIGLYKNPIGEYIFKSIQEDKWFSVSEEMVALLHMLPYPTKAWFMQDKTMSIDESNFVITQKLQQIFLGWGILTEQVKCPTILVGHCNVADSKLSNGQTIFSQDIIITVNDLELACAEYNALGHIHKDQQIGTHSFYAGSTHHQNWGETEPKFFNVVEMQKGSAEVRKIQIPSRPMAKHEAKYVDGGVLDDLSTEKDWIDAELRVRVTVRAEQRKLITEEDVKRCYPEAYSYQVEWVVVPDERIRSEAMAKVQTLPEKVGEWGRVNNISLDAEVLEHAADVERQVAL